MAETEQSGPFEPDLDHTSGGKWIKDDERMCRAVFRTYGATCAVNRRRRKFRSTNHFPILESGFLFLRARACGTGRSVRGGGAAQGARHPPPRRIPPVSARTTLQRNRAGQLCAVSTRTTLQRSRAGQLSAVSTRTTLQRSRAGQLSAVSTRTTLQRSKVSELNAVSSCTTLQQSCGSQLGAASSRVTLQQN